MNLTLKQYIRHTLDRLGFTPDPQTAPAFEWDRYLVTSIRESNRRIRQWQRSDSPEKDRCVAYWEQKRNERIEQYNDLLEAA